MGNKLVYTLTCRHTEKRPSSKSTKEVRRRFSEVELRLVKATYKDLASRCPGKTIDRPTFLKQFPLPGLHGEQLFDIFDLDKTGAIDYLEFLRGMAVCYKGSLNEKLDLIFQIYDISKDGQISSKELTTMLHQIPSHLLVSWYKSKNRPSLPSARNLVNRGQDCNENEDGGNDVLLKSDIEDNKIESKESSNSEGQEEVYVVELIIEQIVKEAFASCSSEINETLSETQFKHWIATNPEVSVLIDGVFATCHSPFTCAPSFGPSKPRHLKPLLSLKGKQRSQSLPSSSREISPKPSHISNSQLSLQEKPWPEGGAGLLNIHYRQENIEFMICAKEGYLGKRGKRYRTRHTRYFRLYGNVLYYFARQRSTLPMGVISINGCLIVPLADQSEPNNTGFKILTNVGCNNEKILYAANESERREWMDALKLVSKAKSFDDEYDLKEKLGEGKYAEVYLCHSKKTTKPYAVKIMNTAFLEPEEVELLRTEIAIMRMVQHPLIVQFIDVFEEKDTTYIVMELLEGGELLQYITTRKPFSEVESYILLRQLLLGVKYLHKAGIAHRDIKPENILLVRKMLPDADFSTFQIKFSDFGLSKLVAPDEILKLPCGTLSYVAPEVLAQKGYGIEADMWSIGIIMHLLIKGRLPYEAEKKEDAIKAIMKNEIDWKGEAFWSKVSPLLIDLLSRLLTKDYKLRLTAEQALRHPWMKLMRDKCKAVSPRILEYCLPKVENS